MFEKVNPSHPDKIADRIAGAIVDIAYKKSKRPAVAAEVLIGHGICSIINETDTHITASEIREIVDRIAGKDVKVHYEEVKQDDLLNANQYGRIKCGDNGIFRGSPISKEEWQLTKLAQRIYREFPYDGKYLIDNGDYVICQSHARATDIVIPNGRTNPIGEWTGGINVDSGATNRKIGSDIGHAATGGGLHGKDLSKADVSINIYAFLKAQTSGTDVEISCAIGDEIVDGRPYAEIVNIARQYIEDKGGFEKLAEWGLIR